MYAIVKINNSQIKVSDNKKFVVNKMHAKVGEEITLDKVLLYDDGKSTIVGTPYVEDKLLKATVNRHFKGKKVIVFKKKRRKGYKVKNGHKQHLTELSLSSI